MNTIEALQALYVKLGGDLTDTYEDISGGVPVSDYAIIPDMIAAVAKKATPSGGDSYVGTAETTGSSGASEPEAEFSLDITAGELFALINSGKTASFICKNTDFPQYAFVINITAVQVAPARDFYRVQAVKTTASGEQSYKTTIVPLVGESIAADANVALVPAVAESVDANSNA